MADERAPLTAPLTSVALALVGAVTAVLSFSVAVGTALGGDPIGHLIAIFAIGAALDLAGIVVAVVCLVRGIRRGVAVIGLLIGLAPVVVWLAIAIPSNLAGPG